MKYLLSVICFAIVLLCTCSNENEPVVNTDPVPPESSQKMLDVSKCFFGPTGNLRVKLGEKNGDAANGNSEVLYVDRWEIVNDTIVWGVNFYNVGRLTVTPVMGVSTMQAGSEVTIMIGDEKHVITLVAGKSDLDFVNQPSAEFNIPKAGLYTVNLILTRKTQSAGSVANVKSCSISGSPAATAVVETKRWRPAALHYQIRSSQATSGVETVIMETVIKSPDVWSYSPITTPFGYAGVAWDFVKQQFSGINFSLWRDGTRPHHEWSHLIAVGPGRTFGAYDHEGAGVKPRGLNSYDGYKLDRTAIAVTKEPGIPFDTYYSYYWDPAGSKRWILFGCGKDYNKNGKLTALTTGGFVEVTGNATFSRSGHRCREVWTRGWGITSGGKKVIMDQMTYAISDEPASSYKSWGQKDGYFVVKAGGFGVGNTNATPVTLKGGSLDVDFMSDEALADLKRFSAIIEAKSPVSISKNGAVVRVNATEFGTNPETTLYWGTADELTFADKEIGKYAKWENQKVVNIKKGDNDYAIGNLIPGTTYYWRLSVSNKEGVTWLFETESFKTKE